MPVKRSAATALQEGANSTANTKSDASSSSATTGPNKKRKMGSGKQKFYAVKIGRKTGVFLTYDECRAQVEGYPRPIFKSFESKADAEAFVAGRLVASNQAKAKFYAVAVGDPTGIFRDYADVQDAIAGVKGAVHKSFLTEAEAVQFIKERGSKQALEALGDKAAAAIAQVDGSGTEKKPVVKAEPAKEAKPDETGFLKIYTDGSSRGNGRQGARAGLGVFFGPSDPRNISERLPGDLQTNQRGELMAIQRALETVPSSQDIQIITDSQYSINCVTKWAMGWEMKQWKTAQGEDVKNRDIVERTVRLIKERKGRTDFKWVRGHAVDAGNIAADALAVQGALKDKI